MNLFKCLHLETSSSGVLVVKNGCCRYPSYIHITAPFIALSTLLESVDNINFIYQSSIHQQFVEHLHFHLLYIQHKHSNGSSKFQLLIEKHTITDQRCLKNIPLPTKDAYLKSLIHKLESFIKRIRWKAFFFENKNKGTNEITTNFNYLIRVASLLLNAGT